MGFTWPFVPACPVGYGGLDLASIGQQAVKNPGWVGQSVSGLTRSQDYKN